MAEFEELKNLLRQPRKSGCVAFLYNWQRIQNNRTCDPSHDFLLQAQEVIGWIRVKIVADDIWNRVDVIGRLHFIDARHLPVLLAAR